MSAGGAADRLQELWDLRSDRHDRDTDFHDSCPLGDSRSWVFSLAMAQVLDVATGTGLNLPFYPRNVQLTGIDFNPATLALSGEAGSLLSTG